MGVGPGSLTVQPRLTVIGDNDMTDKNPRFRDAIRQGEILFIPVDDFGDDDANYQPVSPEGDYLIVGHSETGHHHVIDLARSPNAQLLIDKTNEFQGRLAVGEDVKVDHLRSFDTHAPADLPAGKYRVAWRREYTPEGLRRVQD